MKSYVVRFLKDEFGATAIEYGLIAALIAVGIIAAARALGSQVGLTFNTVADEMREDLSGRPPASLWLRGRSPTGGRPRALSGS